MFVRPQVHIFLLLTASAGFLFAENPSQPMFAGRTQLEPRRLPLPAVVSDNAAKPVGVHWSYSEVPYMPAASDDISKYQIAPAGHCTDCSDPCIVDCGCSACQSCLPAWAHRTGGFGEYLALRARNADIAYAVPIDGGITPPILPPPVQRGAVAVADPELDSGFRVGGVYAFDCNSSIVATFTRFESNTSDSVSTSAPLALRQLVLHPQSLNATDDYIDASANLGLEYYTGDIDYRAAFLSNESSVLNYVVGFRYVRLEQDFAGVFTNAGTTELLATGIDFEGAGLRLGIDGERHVGCRGVLFYAKGMANLIGGESSGYYTQSTSPTPPTVDMTWSAARMITILELEVGGGWQSCCGRYRVTAGYQYNAWQDLVTADKFIDGVQNNNFVDMSDTITFDGLNARIEYRW